MMEKSNLDRKRDQHSCWQFRFWDSQKYVRFQQSFRISIVCLVPSRMCLHSSRPQMMDRSSLMWISQFISASERLLDMNPTGCHLSSSHSWDKTAPMAYPEVSISSQNCAFWLGCTRMGVEVMSCLSSSKAFCLSSAHLHTSPFLVSWWRGLATCEKSWMNHWYKLMNLMNNWTSVTFLWVSQSQMLATLIGSIC